jgi:hypothetical protein
LSESGKWKRAKNKGKYLFNVKAMSPVFSAKYVALLRKSGVEIPQKIYKQVFKKRWVVFAKKPFSSPKYVIEYLGRYTHYLSRPIGEIAISNHRIQSIDYQNRQVTFSIKEYIKGGRKSTVKLSTQEFIRRFGLHILPKGFTRIRHYGILSSRWKKEKLPQLQATLATNKLTTILPKEPLLHRQCSSCKKGSLHTVLVFDARGPPQNWRQLLKDKVVIVNI